MTNAFAVKICGLSTPETLAAAIAAGAEMVGLVFHPKSPRHVALDTALALAAQARGKAQIVALTVDWTPRRAAELAAALKPDLLQLHGSETPEQAAAIAREAGRPVMKAIGVSSARDLAAMAGFAEAGARLLLDAKAAPGAAYPGGHGRPFDWALVADLDPGLPFMLGGGLGPANVAEAVRIARPAGVDVSSGVESAPGVKDVGRIEAFVRAAREAAAAS
jgi:phosphoribosylanthranilate isomerase